VNLEIGTVTVVDWEAGERRKAAPVVEQETGEAAPALGKDMDAGG
jgi:hypothetical protein